MNAPVTPWDNPGFKRHPQVLYPDQLGERVDLYDQLAIVEHYEKLARKARRRGRFGFANRATREPSRVSPSRPSGRVSAIACVALSLLTLAYFAWQFAGRPGL